MRLEKSIECRNFEQNLQKLFICINKIPKKNSVGLNYFPATSEYLSENEGFQFK